LQQAAQALEERTRLIRLRQKSIRLADHSEFRWSVVTEYDADELAEDSDDEKKIEKAERAAERKAALARKKRSRTLVSSGVASRDFSRYPGSPRKLLEGASAAPNSNAS